MLMNMELFSCSFQPLHTLPVARGKEDLRVALPSNAFSWLFFVQSDIWFNRTYFAPTTC